MRRSRGFSLIEAMIVIVLITGVAMITLNLLNAEQRLVSAQYRTKLYEISLMQISGRVGELVNN